MLVRNVILPAAKLPTEIKLAALRAYEDGRSSFEVARLLGINHSTVRKWAKAAGINRERELPNEIKEAALSAYEAGFTLKETSAMLGVGTTTISYWVKVNGVGRGQGISGLGPPIASGNGYLVQTVGKDHWLYPHANGAAGYNSRRMPQHRIVMAEHIGRPLRSNETVHHLNGDRADNRIENLELHPGSHGAGQRWICANCGCSDRKAIPLGA